MDKIILVYNKLLEYYSEQHWWPCNNEYEMMVGAILTQNTNWKNVEKAIKNLGNLLNPVDILQLDNSILSELIRSSGYYNQKTIKLKILTQWYKKYDFNIGKVRVMNGDYIRNELLGLYGVGNETADSILLYALKKPYFIIDTYTRRLFSRLGYNVPKKYDEFRLFIEENIKKDIQIYNEFHALIVIHGKHFCLKKPQCTGCPINYFCPWFSLEFIP